MSNPSRARLWGWGRTNSTVAEEAMNYLVEYLQRLKGDELRRMKEDMATLAGFAKSEKWPKQLVRFLQDFLKDNGITG